MEQGKLKAVCKGLAELCGVDPQQPLGVGTELFW